MKKLLLFTTIIFILLRCAKEKDFPLTADHGSQVKQTVIFSTTTPDAFYSFNTATGYSKLLLLGKYKDEYNSKILLQFKNLPDSAIVDTARIILFPAGILGDSSSGFQAKMYPISSSWKENDITEPPNYSFEVLSSAAINPTAADSDSVIFNLTPSIVQQWIAGDTNGVIIESEAASFIQTFSSVESGASVIQPKLRIAYHTIKRPDTTLYRKTIPANDAFVLISQLSNLPKDLLYIGAGVPFHSFLKFNLGQAIDSVATINKAEIRLVINKEFSLFEASGAANLIAKRVNGPWTNINEIPIDTTLSGYTPSIVGDTLSLTITGMAQYWSLKDTTYANYGFLLQSYYEYQTLSRIAFYSATADSLHAPKLIVTYTVVRPENYF